MNNRESCISRDSIEYSFWLAMAEDGTLTMTRKEPRLDRRQRAMALTLKVPRTIFRTPTLKASIEIADPGLTAPAIDISAASAALRDVIGCDVQIEVKGGDL